MFKRILVFAAVALALTMLQGYVGLAGDGGRPFTPDPRATEPGYDAGLYEGVGYEPPPTRATPVPPEFVTQYGVQSLVSGTINQTTTAYYGPSSAYVARETLYSGKSVSVIEKAGSYFHIEYATSGGSVRAYVVTTAVSGDFSTVPTASNNISRYGLNVSGATATVYGGPSTASFVSIGSGVSSGRTVRAITTGVAEFWTYYENDPLDGFDKFVSYGNLVILNFGSNRAYYAHLSSFAGWFPAPTYPNFDPPKGWSSLSKSTFHGGRTISEPNVALGATGNTGYSTGPHLHFEIRESNVNVDPFKYVLFAKMPW